MGRAIPLPTLRALVACKGGTFTFTQTKTQRKELALRSVWPDCPYKDGHEQMNVILFQFNVHTSRREGTANQLGIEFLKKKTGT